MCRHEVIFAVVAMVLLAVAPSTDATVLHEVDAPVYNLLLPINASSLDAFLPQGLGFRADLYNGQAFVSIQVTQTVSIKFKILGHFIPVPVIPTYFVMAYAFVKRNANGDDRTGLYMFSIDFANSFGGWMNSIGCTDTQPGVRCSESQQFHVDTRGTVLLANDNAKVTAGYTITNVTSDPALVNWVVNRPWKYSTNPNGGAYESQMMARDIPAGYQACVDLSGVTVSSDLLTQRYPLLGGAEKQPGAPIGFWCPSVQFIDQTATPINSPHAGI